MSLNTRVGLVLLLVVAAAPLWVPVSPALIWWLARERRAGRALGLTTLPRCLASAVAGYAEATMAEPPPGGWQQVARNVDAYLSAVRSPRHWRTLVMLAMLEFAPLVALQRPLSRMPRERRRRWIERRLATTRGLMAVPSLARQLVRMGYYCDPAVARGLGFVPMGQRARQTRAPRRELGQRAVG